MNDQSKHPEASFAMALARAQSQIGPCRQSGRNVVAKEKTDSRGNIIKPEVSRAYATLHDVWEACRIPLSSNGIAVMHLPRVQTVEAKEMSPSGEEVTMVRATVLVETILMHEDGGSMRNTLELPAVNTSQGIGSAITYAKRYNLAAMTGVAPRDDDDDGAGADGGVAGAEESSAEAPKRAAPKSQRDLTREIYAAYRRACKDAGHEPLSVESAARSIGIETFDGDSISEEQWAALGALLRGMTRDIAAERGRSDLSSRVGRTREPGEDDE